MQKIINAGLVGFLIFFIFTCAAQGSGASAFREKLGPGCSGKPFLGREHCLLKKSRSIRFLFQAIPSSGFLRQRSSQERIQRALGSGVIVSENGSSLPTTTSLAVRMRWRSSLPTDGIFPKIIGTDPQSDVAVIKIDAKGLPAIKTADSSKLHIGDFVLAVGNPFGLQQTVTHGIISALGRSGLGITDYENFIQTDAPGLIPATGGALVNTKGELIGLNTAILSQSGGAWASASRSRSISSWALSGASRRPGRWCGAGWAYRRRRLPHR